VRKVVNASTEFENQVVMRPVFFEPVSACDSVADVTLERRSGIPVNINRRGGSWQPGCTTRYQQDGQILLNF
jgi:hypothetical protein